MSESKENIERENFRKNCESFARLDDFEKILLLAISSGLNFAEIGTMKWIPEEMKHPQSKQFIRNRWEKLIQKFPVAATLHKWKARKNSTDEDRLKFANRFFEQQTLDLFPRDETIKKKFSIFP